MTIYEHIMAVKTPTRPEPEFTTKDYLDARDAVIRSELSGIGDRLTGAVGELRTDIDNQFGELDREIRMRPTTNSLRKTVWSGAGAVFLGILAVLFGLWAAVDTGASMTASFSDRVLASQDQYENVSQQVSAVDVKYEQIDAKLDKLIFASGGNAADFANTATTTNSR